MKQLAVVAVVLTLSILLMACQAHTPPVSDDTSPETALSPMTDTAPVTDLVTEPADDGFDAVRASDELWLQYGLDAYLSGKATPELTEFFAEPAHLSYLTLYADMFFYDEAKSLPVAAALFRFIADEYGRDALTDTARRVEYKSAYLASLGIESGYPQDPAIEALLSRMTASSDTDWTYILTIDNTTYYLNDFSQGSISQYHRMLYYNTVNLASLIDHVRETMPQLHLDTDRHFHYYLTFNGQGTSYTTTEDGHMYINDASSMLHESLHAMGLYASTIEHIWLSEGLCNYITKLSGLDTLWTSSTYQIMAMAAMGALDASVEAGDVQAALDKRLSEAYVAAGGSLASADELDLRLHSDLWAALERAVLGSSFRSIGDGYRMIDWEGADAVGMDLSYAEATSLVAYLVKTYGMDAVWEAYETQDLMGAFGHSFDELRSAWQASLPTP